MTDESLQRWITSETGREVRHLERVGYGASRATFIAEMTSGGDLVARVDTGEGPMAGTELSLAREAEVYRALAGTGIRIPRLRAVESDGSVLLTERAAGTHEMTALDAPRRERVYDDFIDEIARLHCVDVTSLDLPSFRRPTDARSHALEELDLWGGILHARTTGAWPLAHFALRVLRDAAPVGVERTVICHGDVGPGNFMHDGSTVTALLDWEFSHLGDPMDDLAWWLFRGHDMDGRCGDLADQLRRWETSTGLTIDPVSIEYYRAFVILRWLVCVASALDRGGPSMDRSVYYALIPILSVRLPRSLAALLRLDLPDPPPPVEHAPGPNAEVIDALRSDIADVLVPAATTPEVRRRAAASLQYVSHLAADDGIGPTLRRAELDDVEAVLGSRPDDPDSLRVVDHALARAARSPDSNVEGLLGYFWRSGHRRAALWPLSEAVALGVPTPVPER